nr:hypothetical protein GCM10017745_74560 [Saccharothrix mutabilis subsp. capreolus]
MLHHHQGNADRRRLHPGFPGGRQKSKPAPRNSIAVRAHPGGPCSKPDPLTHAVRPQWTQLGNAWSDA